MAFKEAYSKTFDVEEPGIGYPRFGRTLKFNKYLFLLQSTFLVVVFEFLVAYFLQDYFKLLSSITKSFLADSYTASYKLLNFTIEYSTPYGRLPTAQESLIYFIVSLLLLLFLISRLNPLSKFISAWLMYITFVYLVSSLYFLFFLDKFPYTEKEFAKLYTLQQTGTFIFIPIILGLSLSIFTFSWLNPLLNTFTVAITLLYSSVFGGVRYIIFTYILKELSYIHMPAMFFLFGPLLDFIYIVSFYSLCVYVTLSLYHKRWWEMYRWGF